MLGTFDFGGNNGSWGGFGGTSAQPEINASLIVSQREINYADNSVTSVDKTSTLVNSQTPFAKEKFITELTQTINKLIQIQEAVNNQKPHVGTLGFLGGSNKKHTISITLTYHE